MKKKRPFSFSISFILLVFLFIILIMWQIIWTAVRQFHTVPEQKDGFDIAALKDLHFIPGSKETDVNTLIHRYGYSITKSLSIPHTRSLPYTMDARCQSLRPSSTLQVPSVSAVVTYQEVDRSVLLRNLASILQRSKPANIKEMIIVDDGSSDADAGKLLQKLKGFQVMRNERSKGRGIARMQGASAASGEIIVFIDSLSEMNVDWLSPLLYTLAENPKSLAAPVFDSVDHVTFEYKPLPSVFIGGIDWSLQFRWEEIPLEKQNYSETHRPFKSPIQSGAVYAVRKDFFTWVGKYDTITGASGAEDIDLSLRIWLCGGQIKIVPCSRVGLINTSRGHLGVRNIPFSTYLRGAKKVAELWLDDYKRFFYAVRPSARMQPLSDLSSFRKLKEKNKCRGFKWFLSSIYPQLLPLVSDEIAYGTVRQQESCMDIDRGQMPLIAKLRPCKPDRDSQEWSWRKKGLIVSNGMCLTSDLVNMHGYVVVQFCQELTNQAWYRRGKKIMHRESNLCLDSVQGDLALIITSCVKDLPSQAWQITSEMQGLPSSELDFSFSEDKTQLY